MRGKQAVLLTIAVALSCVLAASLVWYWATYSYVSSELNLDLVISHEDEQLLYEGEDGLIAPCAETAPLQFKDGSLAFSAVLLASDSYWLEPPQSVTVELHRVVGCVDQLVNQSVQPGTGYIAATWTDLPSGRYYLRLVRNVLTASVTAEQIMLCWVSNSD